MSRSTARRIQLENLEPRQLLSINPVGVQPTNCAEICITASVPTNDPYASQLYGIERIAAPQAWQTTRGSEQAIVAVIDTGIDYLHPDLADNVWHNTREIPGDQIDNDRNGFVDDVVGWDFAANDNSPWDENGHGTHVAGTIAAVGDNRLGVVGVAPNVSVLPVRFLGAAGGGTLSNAVRSIDYVVGLKRLGANIVAINASWGSVSGSAELESAIRNAGAAGILFIAAAGNDATNIDTHAFYPASYTSTNIVAVAATDSSDRIAAFSNFGTTQVDVAAPGVNILSTLPGGRYGTLSGTSMATPHVAAMAALVASANPASTMLAIRDAILASVDKFPTLSGNVATSGRINAARAFDSSLPQPPAAPAVSVVNRTLRIVGTDADNSVRVYQAGDRFSDYLVDIQGQTLAFTWYTIDRLEFYGLAGNDRLQNDTDLPTIAYGGAGNDTLIGGSGRDALLGEDGNDELQGRRGTDRLVGGAGNDRLIGGNGDDILQGGTGRDVLIANAGDDRLSGGKGNDQLRGGTGNDRLSGGLGRDTLRGGSGQNQLVPNPIAVKKLATSAAVNQPVNRTKPIVVQTANKNSSAAHAEVKPSEVKPTQKDTKRGQPRNTRDVTNCHIRWLSKQLQQRHAIACDLERTLARRDNFFV